MAWDSLHPDRYRGLAINIIKTIDPLEEARGILQEAKLERIRLIADGADAEALAVAEENVEGAKKLLEITLIDQGRTLRRDADAVR
jgi:hypothetical protein